MTAFKYKALDREGKTCQGIMQGDAARPIRQKLREQGLLPLEVTQVESKDKKWVFYRFNSAERLLFTRQLATLLNAGLTVEQALEACAQQTTKNQSKSVILALRSSIMEGQTLSYAFASFPKIFGSLYQATAAAGEHSGQLDTALMHLADYLEAQQQMKQKVLQAILYPAIMSTVAIIIVIFLLAYVVPPLIELFEDSQQALPFSTRLLIALSHHIPQIACIGGFGVLLLALLSRFLYKNTLLKTRWHATLLKLPLIGNLTKLLNVSRFCHTLAILSRAGVNLLFATKTASLPVNSLPIRHALENAHEKIREGSSIQAALQSTGYFPAVTLYLVASGEKSGRLDHMLEKAALNLQNDIQRQLNFLLTLFEPLLIITMGSIVLFIVVAILLPIFNLNQLIQ